MFFSGVSAGDLCPYLDVIPDMVKLGIDYISLDRAKNAPSEKDILSYKEKAEAVCKVLAAYSLKKLGRKFDKKEIRETAEHINTIYCIKDNVRGRKLDEILQDKAAEIYAENEELLPEETMREIL